MIPLPEPELKSGAYGYRMAHVDYFSADQMHAYAAARVAEAVAAERERCAKVCADAWEIDGSCTALEFANLIRASSDGG
jgi:hypothetical protein